MKKPEKVIVSILISLIIVILIAIIPTKETLRVKEGSILDVNDYISSSSLGGSENFQSNFYLTYVETRNFTLLSTKIWGILSGYKKNISLADTCRDFNAQDRDVYSDRLLPYMGLNAISAAMNAADMEPMGVLLDPVVLNTSYKSEIGKQFKPGDKIISLNGEEKMTGDLINVFLNRYNEGDEIKVIIDRDGERKEIDFIANERDCNNHLTAGIYVETTLDILGVDEEKIIDISKMSFSGNSAGLMLSLGLYQQLKPEVDLTKGKKVAGTGAINVIGQVGEIGSLDMKIRTAIKEGADIFLFPKSQSDEILGHYEGEIILIPVETLEESIEILTNL